MRTHFTELSLGTYDISFAPVRRGWDPGDPLTSGAPVLVEAADLPPVLYDWMWDYI